MTFNSKKISLIQRQLIHSLEMLASNPNILENQQVERLEHVIAKLKTVTIPEKKYQDYWNVFTFACLLPTQIREIMTDPQNKELLQLLSDCQDRLIKTLETNITEQKVEKTKIRKKK